LHDYLTPRSHVSVETAVDASVAGEPRLRDGVEWEDRVVLTWLAGDGVAEPVEAGRVVVAVVVVVTAVVVLLLRCRRAGLLRLRTRRLLRLHLRTRGLLWLRAEPSLVYRWEKGREMSCYIGRNLWCTQLWMIHLHSRINKLVTLFMNQVLC
jgi:hypothetical protein